MNRQLKMELQEANDQLGPILERFLGHKVHLLASMETVALSASDRVVLARALQALDHVLETVS